MLYPIAIKKKDTKILSVVLKLETNNLSTRLLVYSSTNKKNGVNRRRFFCNLDILDIVDIDFLCCQLNFVSL